jgi:hypothetical protein
LTLFINIPIFAKMLSLFKFHTVNKRYSVYAPYRKKETGRNMIIGKS